jgi:agmatinase
MMNYKPVDSQDSPRFSGIKTFMRLPYSKATKNIDFAITGIPFDTAASYRVGTRFGPSAIRDISSLTKPYNPELDIDIFEYCNGIDFGDVKTIPGYIEDSLQTIQDDLEPLFQSGIVPISMGGDHLVTLPELRACHSAHQELALIHFDSHYDTWKEYFGKPYNHGTPFRIAANEKIIEPSKSIQIGLRGGLYTKSDIKMSPNLGFEVIRAVECHKIGTEEIVQRIIQRVGNTPAFLSFDIDYLDPSYAPGTGTPEIGGFTTAEALEIIRGLKHLNIVGYDVVEVAPQYDSGQITALAAANIIVEFMSHVAYRKRATGRTPTK